MATGIATNITIGPYWAAPLQPSVSQIPQNWVVTDEGELLVHSFDAFSGL